MVCLSGSFPCAVCGGLGSSCGLGARALDVLHGALGDPVLPAGAVAVLAPLVTALAQAGEAEKVAWKNRNIEIE